MYRRTIKLGGPLADVSLTPSAALESTPAAANDVLAFPPPAAVEMLALRNVLTELSMVIAKLQTREQASIESLGQAAVELAVAVAERLVSAEIAADRQRLDRMVRDALERTQPARAITVRGHADDLASLQRQIAEHGELTASPTALTFRTDKACERGQLKIEADEWFVEFDTQRSLTELRDRLLEETFANE